MTIRRKVRVRGVVAMILASLGVCGVLSPIAAEAGPVTPPQPAGSRANMLAAPDLKPVYPGVNVEYDVPITMDDGVRLRADVYRPADAQGRTVTKKLPVVVAATPYTKFVSAVASAVVDGVPTGQILNNVVTAIDPALSRSALDGVADILQQLPSGGVPGLTGLNKKLVRRGFVQVVVDVRGQGNSPGDDIPLMNGRERRDMTNVIEWARTRGWSSGRIGMTGESYLGGTTMEAAVANPRGLQAIIPIVPMLDFGRAANEGGAMSLATTVYYGILLELRYLPPFSAILTGRYDSQWLSSRLKNPLPHLTENAQYVLGHGAGTPAGDMKFFWPGRQTPMKQIADVRAKTLLVGGWNDVLAGQYADMYRTMKLPPGQKQMLMGNWNHVTIGTRLGTGPGIPPNLTDLSITWFERWLKDAPNGIDKQGPVTLAQLGGTWTTSTNFPRPGAQYRRVYLTPTRSSTAPHSVYDGSLDNNAPQRKAAATVSPGAAMLCSRDTARDSVGILSVLGQLCTGRDAVKESQALTFTSAPVTTPTTYSGTANLHLNVSTPATEAIWNVSVNDVAPDGTSVVRAVGHLASTMRAVDTENSRRLPNGDYTQAPLSLRRADIQPLQPHQRHTVDIELMPTDLVLQPGHRLRINILATNLTAVLPNAQQLVATRLAPQTVWLDPSAPSFLTFPVVGRTHLGTTPPGT